LPKLGFLVGGLAAVALALLFGLRYHARKVPAIPAADSAAFESPYLNTRPNVRYVGDAACASCHPDIAARYRRHPMARDVIRITDLADQEDLRAAAQNPFMRFGLQFRVVRKDGEEFHELSAQDAQGRLLLRHQDQVLFAIGSGKHGRSFVVSRDGSLFQSPISWYAEPHRWGLSNGFTAARLGGMPVDASCLSCHCSATESVDGTVNRFHEPLKHANAIGCERCHGPGELHVAGGPQNPEGQDVDRTIVNPVHLEPALRDAVCQQCHMNSGYRILRLGRSFSDYRPGLPLDSAWSVYVKPAALAEDYRTASRPEQMRSSRCFAGSGGKLGCISCHDPHEQPAPQARIAFYRERCLRCHTEATCALPTAVRRQRDRDDSCIACHMPSSGSKSSAHAHDTDHRIRRQPDQPGSDAAPVWRPGDPLLTPFPLGPHGAGESEEARGLGIALVKTAEESEPLRRQASLMSLSLLEEAVRQRPDDFPAWQAKARALRYLGSPEQAMADLERALALSPRQEITLQEAATLATDMDNVSAAVAYWRRLLAVNPASTVGHASLAGLLVKEREWSAARTECEAALQLDPTNINARLALSLCLLRTDHPQEARDQVETLASLLPARAGELRRWIEEQQAPRR
jgi:tetratricopeptide (TPR) repeat protein